MNEAEIDRVINRRKNFIHTCCDQTKALHEPLDLTRSQGGVNPDGFGEAKHYAQDFINQYGHGTSTIAHISPEHFFVSNRSGTAYPNERGFGPAEYGVVRSPAAARVADKIAQLHGAKDALCFPSGLKAIDTLFATFPEDINDVILLPDTCYYPAMRALSTQLKAGHDMTHPPYEVYEARAAASDIQRLIETVEARGQTVGMIYMEAPSSRVYHIPDIEGIIKLAQQRGIMSAIDNTAANHVGFKPMDHGFTFGVEGATKYQSGYGDTPFGYIYSNDQAALNKIAYKSRCRGDGSVAVADCGRLYHRLDTAQERMEAQYQTALTVIDYLQSRADVKDILAPYLPHSPDYARFQTYFKQGNSLFTVVFDDRASKQDINTWLGQNPLMLCGESWGGHLSLYTPYDAQINAVRMHMGLEDANDIIKAFETAGSVI